MRGLIVSDNIVRSTKNYSIFKTMNGNRIISRRHLKKMQTSMAEKYIPVPIIVNEKNHVIDGQHRLASAEALNMPIHYIVIDGLNLHDVQKLNSTSRRWTNDDFMDSYCDLGLSDYLAYREFKERHGFPHHCNFLMLAGPKNEVLPQHTFHQGKMRLSAENLEWADKAAVMIMQIAKFYEEGECKDGRGSKKFVEACCRAFRIPEYKHQTMLKKLKTSKKRLRRFTTVQDHTRQLEEVYFYKARGKKFRLD